MSARAVFDVPVEKVAYSRSEAATALGIGLTMLTDLEHAGEIKSFRLGRRVLIRKRDLQAFVDGLFAEQNAGGPGL